MLLEIQGNFDSDVKLVSEAQFNTLSNYYAVEDNSKYVVVYMYDDQIGASFMFKALSADADLQQDFIFMAVYKPSEMMTGRESQLPNLLVKLKQNGKVMRFFGIEGLDYITIKHTLLNLVHDKLERFIELQDGELAFVLKLNQT